LDAEVNDSKGLYTYTDNTQKKRKRMHMPLLLLTITRGRHNRPVSGRRAEWTQFGLHPPLGKLKKNVEEVLYFTAFSYDSAPMYHFQKAHIKREVKVNVKLSPLRRIGE
jgi:hypothetical protein